MNLTAQTRRNGILNGARLPVAWCRRVGRGDGDKVRPVGTRSVSLFPFGSTPVVIRQILHLGRNLTRSKSDSHFS